jgi:molecular chaperone GrpE
MSQNDNKQNDLNIVEKNEPEIDTDSGDDVVFEENIEAVGADYAAKIAKLKARIKELEAKNAELLDGWQRERAEAVNWKKREEESHKELVKFAKSDIIAELLSVLDSFEAAFKNKEAWEKADKNWRMGVEYIHSQFLNILTQNGLAVINPIGEKYDSIRDEAVEMLPVENESDDGKILEVVRIGYSLHGKELRAPKVKVGIVASNK